MKKRNLFSRKRWLATGMSLAMVVSLLPSTALAADSEAGEIGYGEENFVYTITENGSYGIAKGATGTIILGEGVTNVTLVGDGATWDASYQMDTSTMYDNLFIDATNADGATITLKNVYISNSNSITCADGSGCGVIGFDGTGNTLKFEGTNVIEYQVGGGSNPSGIHVATGDALTIGGEGTLYFYKSAQGSGIGGSSKELNGDITFEDLTMFAKGSKQGALIGAGSNSASAEGVPGKVTFESGEYNLVSVSRGAVIGGSAGAGGASSGTEVHVKKDANININVDYSGAAVGGGGYAEGNDASGGTIIIDGGSLRSYIDSNAANLNTTGWNGNAYTQGINDAAITAQRLNSDNKAVYLCSVDTEILAQKATSFDVDVDGKDFYNGGLPEYGFVQEAKDKNDQVSITSTPSNWYKTGETCLYFYLTGEDHEMTINGEALEVAWNADAKSFTVATKGTNHEHEWVEVKGKDATCTETGLTDGVACDVDGCDAVLVKQKEIPAKGHTEVVDAAKAATCKDTGLTEGKHCSVCDEVIVAQNEIPVTSHSMKTLTAKAATCTEDGYTAGRACKNCDYVETEQTVIPALGHNYKWVEVKATTCTEDGHTFGVSCERCDSVLFGVDTVEATGHSFKNGVCKDCEAPLYEIAAMPTYTNYAAGESFDAAGLKITVTNTDDTKTETTNYEVVTKGALTADVTAVQILVKEPGKDEVTISVPVQVYDLGWYTDCKDGQYTISTKTELEAFANIVNGTMKGVKADNFAEKTVTLAKDIAVDADGKYTVVEDVVYGTTYYPLTADQYVVAKDAKQWTPIGAATVTYAGYNINVAGKSFAGTFDGNGHTISGIYTGTTDAATANTAMLQGLFGYVTGTVKNVTVSGCITGKGFLGGVAAYLENGTIENCDNTAVVFGDGGTTPNGGKENGTRSEGAVGGIVGLAAGESVVSGCVNDADITCANTNMGGRVAGIVGLINATKDAVSVSKCANEGMISGYQYVGGIVGMNCSNNSPVDQCYNAGEIHASGASKLHAGGIVGQYDCVISNCYNTGDIYIDRNQDKAQYVGGIAGDFNYSGSGKSKIVNCYTTGTIHYTHAKPIGAVGVICGEAGSAENNYYLDTAGASALNVLYGTVKTADEMQAEAFVGSLNGEEGTAYIQGETWPVLSWQAEAAQKEENQVVRVFGTNRFETSLKTADELKAALGVDEFDAVILTTGYEFADALAGSYLANVKDAPILLIDDAHAADVVAYVKANLSENGTVYVLGGTKAVSEASISGLDHVKRLSGSDRYATNLAILKEAGVAANAEILVCTGANFADSLSATATGKAILLVGETLTAEQKAFVAAQKDATYTVIGGEKAVSAGIASALNAERIGGKTRYETSVLVAKKFFENPDQMILAYSMTAPDGLCGGALACALDVPVVLTATGSESAAAEYAKTMNITSGIVLGGASLISDNAVKTIYQMDTEDTIIVR